MIIFYKILWWVIESNTMLKGGSERLSCPINVHNNVSFKRKVNA